MTCITKQTGINKFNESELFDDTQPNLYYITNNKELLNKHFEYIDSLDYCYEDLAANYTAGIKCKLREPGALNTCISSDGVKMNPKPFLKFKERYSGIYSRWVELVRSCYLPKYIHYKFFGGKGVRLCQEFLDSKQFCKWCLSQGLTDAFGKYTRYLQRIDKTKDYTIDNCFTVTEKEVHEGKNINIALRDIILAKRYDEGHHESITFIIARARYYAFDLTVEDSIYTEYHKSGGGAAIRDFIFSPVEFYKSVATEKSVPRSVFLSRVMFSQYRATGFTTRPYDMLEPDFSISAAANAEHRLSVRQLQTLREKRREAQRRNETLFGFDLN